MTRTFAALAAAFVLAGPTMAEGPTMSGDALKRTLAGKTVVINTPVGGIPVSYRENGTMQGRAKDMLFYTGQERDKGHWWVDANKVCQKWDVWLKAQSYCFTLQMSGSTMHWRSDDGKSGTATIVARN